MHCGVPARLYRTNVQLFFVSNCQNYLIFARVWLEMVTSNSYSETSRRSTKVCQRRAARNLIDFRKRLGLDGHCQIVLRVRLVGHHDLTDTVENDLS